MEWKHSVGNNPPVALVSYIPSANSSEHSRTVEQKQVRCWGYPQVLRRHRTGVIAVRQDSASCWDKYHLGSRHYCSCMFHRITLFGTLCWQCSYLLQPQKSLQQTWGLVSPRRLEALLQSPLRSWAWDRAVTSRVNVLGRECNWEEWWWSQASAYAQGMRPSPNSLDTPGKTARDQMRKQGLQVSLGANWMSEYWFPNLNSVPERSGFPDTAHFAVWAPSAHSDPSVRAFTSGMAYCICLAPSDLIQPTASPDSGQSRNAAASPFPGARPNPAVSPSGRARGAQPAPPAGRQRAGSCASKPSLSFNVKQMLSFAATDFQPLWEAKHSISLFLRLTEPVSILWLNFSTRLNNPYLGSTYRLSVSPSGEALWRLFCLSVANC